MPKDSNSYRRPSEELIKLGRAWLYAQTAAEMLHPIVTKIQADLLNELQINYDPKWTDRSKGELVGRITDPKETYLMSNEDSARYFPALDAAYKAAGYDLPQGYCPYLMADHDR